MSPPPKAPSWIEDEVAAFTCVLRERLSPACVRNHRRGARELLRFLSARPTSVERITVEDFVSFRDATLARGPRGTGETTANHVEVVLNGARSYLRTKMRDGHLSLSDWLFLLYPQNLHEAFEGEPSLAALWREVLAFEKRLAAERYNARTIQANKAGAAALLLFLREQARTVSALDAAAWSTFRETTKARARRMGGGVAAALPILKGARAYLRAKAEDGFLSRGAVPRSGHRRHPSPVLPPSLGALLGDLKDAMELADLSPRTRPSYVRSVRDFLVWLAEAGITDLVTVTRPVMTSYAVQLQQRMSSRGMPFAVSTQIGALAALRFLFCWLVRSGRLLSDPMAHLPRPRAPQHLPQPIGVEEIAALIRSLPSDPRGLRDQAIVEILYGTGMRCSEVASLRLEDIDIEEGTVHVRLGKGRKDRVVPLGRKAKEALTRYLAGGRPAFLRKPTSFVFLASSGLGLSAHSVTQRVKTLGDRLGLRVRPHKLRHSCATHLLKGRADIRHIQRLLGHESLRTTERYTKVEITDLRDVIARCHPREKKGG